MPSHHWKTKKIKEVLSSFIMYFWKATSVQLEFYYLLDSILWNIATKQQDCVQHISKDRLFLFIIINMKLNFTCVFIQYMNYPIWKYCTRSHRLSHLLKTKSSVNSFILQHKKYHLLGMKKAQTRNNRNIHLTLSNGIEIKKTQCHSWVAVYSSSEFFLFLKIFICVYTCASNDIG